MNVHVYLRFSEGELIGWEIENNFSHAAKISLYYSEMCFCTPLTSTKIRVCVVKRKSGVKWINSVLMRKWHSSGIGAKARSFLLEDSELILYQQLHAFSPKASYLPPINSFTSFVKWGYAECCTFACTDLLSIPLHLALCLWRLIFMEWTNQES